jgi:hypothetical protein
MGISGFKLFEIKLWEAQMPLSTTPKTRRYPILHFCHNNRTCFPLLQLLTILAFLLLDKIIAFHLVLRIEESKEAIGARAHGWPTDTLYNS